MSEVEDTRPARRGLFRKKPTPGQPVSVIATPSWDDDDDMWDASGDLAVATTAVDSATPAPDAAPEAGTTRPAPQRVRPKRSSADLFKQRSWEDTGWDDGGWDDEWSDPSLRVSVPSAASPRPDQVDAWLSNSADQGEITKDITVKWAGPDANRTPPPGATWDEDSEHPTASAPAPSHVETESNTPQPTGVASAPAPIAVPVAETGAPSPDLPTLRSTGLDDLVLDDLVLDDAALDDDDDWDDSVLDDEMADLDDDLDDTPSDPILLSPAVLLSPTVLLPPTVPSDLGDVKAALHAVRTDAAITPQSAITPPTTAAPDVSAAIADPTTTVQPAIADPAPTVHPPVVGATPTTRSPRTTTHPTDMPSTAPDAPAILDATHDHPGDHDHTGHDHTGHDHSSDEPRFAAFASLAPAAASVATTAGLGLALVAGGRTLLGLTEGSAIAKQGGFDVLHRVGSVFSRIGSFQGLLILLAIAFVTLPLLVDDEAEEESASAAGIALGICIVAALVTLLGAILAFRYDVKTHDLGASGLTTSSWLRSGGDLLAAGGTALVGFVAAVMALRARTSE